MPNPDDPTEAECRWCYDTGVIPGSDKPCTHCVAPPPSPATRQMLRNTIYAIICCDAVMFASTDYDEVRKRRDSIDSLKGGCPKPHPIRSGRFVQ